MDITKDSQIRSNLRQLWLRSRERSAALKSAAYTCECCGVKQSKAKGREQKVEVHHKAGVLNWKSIFDTIRQQLLCEPYKLSVLCPDCHKRCERE